MGRIKNENYYQVSGWMINELGLKGYELQAFAIIYGFSQDGQSVFAGSVNYLSEWLGTSRQTTTKVLKSLVDKEYLLKEQTEINGVFFNKYKANLPIIEIFTGCQKSLQGVKELSLGCKETLQGGCQKSLQGGVKKFDTIINNNTDTLDNKRITTTTTANNTENDVVAPQPNDIFLLWEKNISAVYPILGEKIKALIDEVGEAAVEQGIMAAVEHGARNFAYVQAAARGIAAGKTKPKVDDENWW